LFEWVRALASMVAAKVTLNPHTQNRRMRLPKSLHEPVGHPAVCKKAETHVTPTRGPPKLILLAYVWTTRPFRLRLDDQEALTGGVEFHLGSVLERTAVGRFVNDVDFEDQLCFPRREDFEPFSEVDPKI